MAQRKKLEVDEETFFLAVQLACGPPKREYFAYVHDRFARGISAWVQHTPEGRRFTQCVTNFGEAKSRASRWYIAYTRWWNKQHGLDWKGVIQRNGYYHQARGGRTTGARQQRRS